MNAAAPSSRLLRVSWAAALFAGLVLRVLPIRAGAPYIAYVDEGNFLHPVVQMLREGRWDSQSYLYPQLPMTLVAAAVRLYAPVYRFRHGQELRSALSPPPVVYDRLEPFSVVGIGRAIGVLLGMGAIGLAGLLAFQIAGPAAGAAAAWLAALAPALVLRSPIATVDACAAFFTTLCLVLADRVRRSARPRLVSLLSGAAAGAAFASKYPAVVVAVVPFVATLLATVAWRERVRRMALIAGGVLAGAILGMPQVVFRARDVLSAIRMQGLMYASIPTGAPLWKQALLRAEWTLTYEHPELGAAFLIAATAGLFLVVRDRASSPTGWGWAAFAAMSVALYGSRRFQPFRNLLPLVPLACAAAAVGYSRWRARMRRPRRLDAVGLACVLALWGAPLAAYGWRRSQLADSRRAAVDWLSTHGAANTSTLVIRDLGILDVELARIPGRKSVRWWAGANAAVRELEPAYVVAGVQSGEDGTAADAALQPWLVSSYSMRARFGSRPTLAVPLWWRGNDQVVYVFERRVGDDAASGAEERAHEERGHLLSQDGAVRAVEER